MSFFQNLFSEFRGNWVLGDRQYSLTFVVPGNKNLTYLLSGNAEPYDFSSSGVLTLNYAWDTDFLNYSALEVDVTGNVASATTAQEVVSLLNADPTFSSMWVAQIYTTRNPVTIGQLSQTLPPRKVQILDKSGRAKRTISLWITNGDAEAVMRFNYNAGVAEIPSYFANQVMDNRFNQPGSSKLIPLDPGDPVDQAIITDAGLDYTVVQSDWQLLRGRSGLFNFQKLTVDGSNRITQIIEYPAGALAGDFARKINYVYTGANTSPNQITEIPYVLQSGDLVTPP